MSDVTASSSTGIYVVKQDVPSDGKIYDLSGRLLNQRPKKGLYLMNGKKIVVN
jgi:hypothetical protein